MKKQLNSNGMTLIEVLAVLVLGSIIALLAINVLFSLVNNKEKIATSANVRDVADFYLESLSNYIYSLNEDNVENVVQSETDGYYIKEKDSPSKITGFKKNGKTVFLYVGGEKTEYPGSNIKISNFPDTKMEKDGENVYKITLTLEYNGKTKTFKKEVHSLP
ncbi:type II secretion system protein [Ureibacillus terrenus]|uniref:Type II secretion system protein n=1 Tax=Ureibacillus terrenus TaxID=118246 RepID=A0A540V6T3_9BACL|nr:type II secretion system protein [Ureibacillus terrenus]MED3660507.1 type II secretion system protein [Ureibacillus terrenus]MED3762660.1 type II secretion system protein [Ureibacillus terrenus]TQE92462.1 type II secretion system protein [Ureibacillus terrenus]